MNYSKLNRSKGFTIIETFVAITILMISIAGPLTISHKALVAAILARDQVVASYLAQDAIEYVKNMRDNNLIRGETDWLRGFGVCTELSPCKVDTRVGDPTGTSNNQITACNANSTTSCGLYKTTTGGYSTSGSGVPLYTRYFFVSPKSGGGVLAGQNEEAKVVVVITWKAGATSNQVIYESELFNVLR